MIRSRIARLFRSLADKLDPPGFEWRVEFGPVADWRLVAEELRWHPRGHPKLPLT